MQPKRIQRNLGTWGPVAPVKRYHAGARTPNFAKINGKTVAGMYRSVALRKTKPSSATGVHTSQDFARHTVAFVLR